MNKNQRYKIYEEGARIGDPYAKVPFYRSLLENGKTREEATEIYEDILDMVCKQRMSCNAVDFKKSFASEEESKNNNNIMPNNTVYNANISSKTEAHQATP